MIRCLVFDFDGTLVRSNEIKRRAFFEVGQSQGAGPEDVESVLDCAAAGDRFQVLAALAQKLEGRGCLPPGLAREEAARDMAEEYSRICETAITVCEDVGGAAQALARLTLSGYQLFVNSATPTYHLRRLVERRSWAAYFCGVWGADSDKPTNLRQILAQTSLPAGDVLCVGDGEDDRTAAAVLGCHFAGVDENPASDTSRFRDAPEFMIDNLSALFAVIDRLNERRSVALTEPRQ